MCQLPPLVVPPRQDLTLPCQGIGGVLTTSNIHHLQTNANNVKVQNDTIKL